jgi:hypothetical protein
MITAPLSFLFFLFCSNQHEYCSYLKNTNYKPVMHEFTVRLILSYLFMVDSKKFQGTEENKSINT